MRKISFFFLLSFALLTGFNAVAQQKFGHINSLELLSLMPGVKEADKVLENYAKQLEDQNTVMITEYQNKIKEYQSKESMMMDAVKEVKLKEIGDLENRIQAFQSSAQDKLSDKKEELYAPILEKAKKAIQDVAKENGFHYVFDTSMGIVLYAVDSDNILSLVKKKLGLP